MAIYEFWMERSAGKYIAHYDRVPPERGNVSYATNALDSPMAAAQELRVQMRKILTSNDQFRVRDRISIYDNINDALEDLLRA